MELPAHRENSGVGYVAGGLAVGAFFAGMAGGVAYPTLPRLGTLIGISPAMVGLIISANGVTRLVTNAPAGSLFDRGGTRWPMVAGFLVAAIAPFGYALGMDPGPVPLSPSVVFLVSRGLWGIGVALIIVGGFATVTHLTTPDNRGRWLGYLLGGNGLGLPVGLVVGGVAADVLGVRAAFLLAGAVGVLSTVLVAAVLPDLSPDVEGTVGLRAVPRLVRADSRVAALGVVGTVLGLLTAVLLSTVVLYAAEHDIAIAGFSEFGVSGVVLGTSVLLASASQILVGRYSDSLANRLRVVVPALILVGAGFLLTAAVPTLVGIVIGVGLAGFGGGAAVPPLLAYLGDISPVEDVGKLGGVYNVFGDIGAIVGPIVALPLGSTVGFAVEYLVCAGLAVLTAVFVGGTLLSAPATPNPELAD